MSYYSIGFFSSLSPKAVDPYSTVSLKFYLDSIIQAKFIVKHPSDLKYSFCSQRQVIL